VIFIYLRVEAGTYLWGAPLQDGRVLHGALAQRRP
jgi:hypothetical protein